MGSLLIRNVDDALRARLKANARAHDRSLEEEARELLRGALARQACEAAGTLTQIALRCFGDGSGDNFEVPARASVEREPIDFGDAAYDR